MTVLFEWGKRTDNSKSGVLDWLTVYVPPIAKERDGWGTRSFVACRRRDNGKFVAVVATAAQVLATAA
jgi:hypothetical protein